MKLQVLVDNNTYIDEYYAGEPAVSYYIEDGDQKILFDTGYSDILISNSKKMGIDLEKVMTIVFSHGHNDHTRGFTFLNESYDLSKVKVIAHQDCFNRKKVCHEDIGSPFSLEELKRHCQVELTNKPKLISKNITFLGEIPQSNNYEGRRAIGIQEKNDIFEADMVLDDSALVYQCEHGLFIITGCSHSGICNIIEYAKKVCHDHRIIGVLGGFHLFKNDRRTEKTIEYLKNQMIGNIYPCHCVSFPVKASIHKIVDVIEVGVGMKLEL